MRMILVTGGAGSIGSEVVRRLVHGGESVRVMDINEEGLWALKCEMPEIDVIVCDVAQGHGVVGDGQHEYEQAFDGVRGVIHCAAMKHVNLCERSKNMAWRVNYQGAGFMLRMAGGYPFVLVSTDKAIEPHSVMGRTKANAEQSVIKHGGNVVRFGNVIGTRGSLVPMVQRCAALGRPIPLTDPNMTRWMMGVDEAVDLILEALHSSKRGLVFSPKNPQAVNIGKFVEMCRDELAPDSDIVRVGMRPGERMHEPMELRDGSIEWSNNRAYAMSDADMMHLIEWAVAHA